MCLAVPMEIVEINGDVAVTQADGTSTKANISLIENLQVGDYVIVHAGFAIEKLDQQEAEARLDLFKELAEKGVFE